MLYYKDGFPEESEILMCMVTKILPHSVFVDIPEYRRGGMIHISEISPGRIRNLRDYVKEGKVIVCKVIRINQERNQIDLSLRRVNEGIKRKKSEWIKQEQKAEKILEFVAAKFKLPLPKLYEEIRPSVFKHYDALHAFFEQIADGSASLDILKIDPKIKEELKQAILQRVKKLQVEVIGNALLQTFDPNGVEIIKKVLAQETTKIKGLSIIYLGGGKYRVTLIVDDYKTAEKDLQSFEKSITQEMEKHDGTASFERQ